MNNKIKQNKKNVETKKLGNATVKSKEKVNKPTKNVIVVKEKKKKKKIKNVQ